MQDRRVATRAIIIEDGKLLCVRLKNNPGAQQDSGMDYWCTPGGGVDVGEPLEIALERELIEETGIKPSIGPLLFVQQFERKNKEQLEFFFLIKNPEDYHDINLGSTSHGSIEIAEIDFVDPKTANVLPKFLTQIDLAKAAQEKSTQIISYL